MTILNSFSIVLPISHELQAIISNNFEEYSRDVVKINHNYIFSEVKNNLKTWKIGYNTTSGRY